MSNRGPENGQSLYTTFFSGHLTRWMSEEERDTVDDSSSQFSTLKSERSRTGTASYYTAGSRSSTATLTSGSAGVEENKWSSDSSQLSSARPDSPRRDRFLRNLRLKLDAIRSESTGALAEEPHKLELHSGGSSTPDLTWLFSEEEARDSRTRNAVAIEPQVLLRENMSSQSQSSVSPGDLGHQTENFLGRSRRRLLSKSDKDGEQPSTSGGADVMNLKEELKILLEEIIETHPEALEAIESVRQSRLGLSSDRGMPRKELEDKTPSGADDYTEIPGTSSATEDGMRRRRSTGGRRARERHAAGSNGRSGSTGLIALADVAHKSGGTHVATSHEDTDEGAVHCFQVRFHIPANPGCTMISPV